MINQLTKKTDIKIYILYMMKNIGYPLDFNTLNNAAVSDGAVDYFGFAECFAELLDTGNIRVEKEGSAELYVITEQGINVVDCLLDTLVQSVRHSAIAAATRLNSFIKRGASLSCNIKPIDNNRYLCDFNVEEKGEKIFLLSIILKNKDQAERVEYNLSNNADAVYKSIMALLSGQADYLLGNDF